MKIKNIYYYLVAFSSAGFVQQFFLDEKPLDFMSATNSFSYPRRY